MKPKTARGFTLIEVLVAIALVAASVTLSYRALSAVINGTEHLGLRIEGVRDIDRLFSLIERDCLHRLPNHVPSARLAGSNKQGSTRFGFPAYRPDEHGAFRSEHVEYRQEGKSLYMVTFDDPSLIIDPPQRRELIFRGVERFEVKFLSPDKVWLDEIDDGAGFYPPAIKVTLRVGNQDAERIFELTRSP